MAKTSMVKKSVLGERDLDTILAALRVFQENRGTQAEKEICTEGSLSNEAIDELCELLNTSDSITVEDLG